MLQKMKDVALSHSVRIAINTQMKDYGKVQKLDLNSKQKSIDLKVMLDGEVESLSVYIENYELTKMDGIHQLKVSGITTSRAWINTVASSYLEGKAFDITEEYAKMLKSVL